LFITGHYQANCRRRFNIIIDAHSHGFHGRYLDKIVAAGGKWAKKTVDRFLRLMPQKPMFLDIALRIEQLEMAETR